MAVVFLIINGLLDPQGDGPAYLDLIAALGRSPVHQSKDVEAHVVLAAAPQREAKTSGTSLQVRAVELGLILTDRQTDRQENGGRKVVSTKTCSLLVKACLALRAALNEAPH